MEARKLSELDNNDVIRVTKKTEVDGLPMERETVLMTAQEYRNRLLDSVTVYKHCRKASGDVDESEIYSLAIDSTLCKFL